MGVKQIRSKCEICDSQEFEILIDKNYKDKDIDDFLLKFYEGRVDTGLISTINYKILKCNSCSFIWHNEILSNELMMLLYDKWISSEHSLNKKLHADLALFESYAAQNALIGRLINKKPFETKVLDFGMGWGFWCKMADAFGFDTYGFEYSKKRIDYASKRNFKIINSQEVLESKIFDFINTEQVFEHVYQPKEVLKKLVHLLSKDGIIRVSVPNGKNVADRIKSKKWTPSKDEIQPLEHINSFDNSSLIELGKQCSLYCINPDNETNLLFTANLDALKIYKRIYKNLETRYWISQKNYNSLLGSKSYKVGNALLKPFKVLIK